MTIRVLHGDCRDVLPTLAANSVHCVVTSPPYYGLRDYGTAQWDGGDPNCPHVFARQDERLMLGSNGTLGKNCTSWTHRDATPPRQCSCGARRVDRQIGLEATPDEYIQTMVAVFRLIRSVLRDDGTVWCNMGDSFSDKQLMMMPARLAIALQADGWWLRSQIVWHKPGPMPESVRDRPTSAYEMVYLLTKRAKYYFDLDAIREPSGAAPRNVWTIPSYPFSEWAQTTRRVCVAWDAPDDGKKRKASLDCPVHADRPDPAPNARDGGRASGLRVHTSHNDIRHGPELADGSSPTGLRLVRSTEAGSSGLPLLECAGVATLHSNQSHRTDLAPATNLACSASAQTSDDTGHILAPPLLSGSAAHTLGSNSEAHGSDDDRSSQKASHIAHTTHEMALSSAFDLSRCTCEWYVEKTEKTSHFATFPPELAERCIKAGTSERGCCAQCGAPWVRNAVAEFIPQTDVAEAKGVRGAFDQKPLDASNGWQGVARGTTQRTTTGWSASCRCDAPTQPCTVLDPFAGAGTTMLVADRLQRHAIGIELNEAYATMARNRIMADAPLFAEVAD